MPRISLPQPHYLFPLGLCILLLMVILFLHLTRVFTFQTIQCQVNDESCPQFIQAELDELKGTSLFRSAYRDKVSTIQEVLPSFSAARAERVFPNTLNVHFERAPNEYAFTQVNVSTRVVDSAGIVTAVFQASQSGELQSSLPQINAPASFVEALQVNNQVETDLHRAILEILRAQSRYNLSFASLEVKNADEIYLTLPDQKIVIVPVKETASALEKLSQVLKTVDFTRLTEKITVIDIRFKYPVLKNH